MMLALYSVFKLNLRNYIVNVICVFEVREVRIGYTLNLEWMHQFVGYSIYCWTLRLFLMFCYYKLPHNKHHITHIFWSQYPFSVNVFLEAQF